MAKKNYFRNASAEKIELCCQAHRISIDTNTWIDGSQKQHVKRTRITRYLDWSLKVEFKNEINSSRLQYTYKKPHILTFGQTTMLV